MTDTDRTRVIFRSFTEYGAWNDPDGVIALFPDIDEGNGSILAYMHHGQHGPATRDLVRTLYTVTPAQRAPLVTELESIGYALDVDTTTPGRLARPYTADRDRFEHYANFRTLKVNSDARSAVVDRVPFANRSHTLTGRPVYVPVGATVERIDGARVRGDEGETVAHIRVTTPADPRNSYMQTPGTDVQTVMTGALPPVHVSALVRALVELSRDPARNHLYVVHSFDTPILWTDTTPGTAEHVPPVRYSATTTKHQANVTGRYGTGTESARAGRGRTPFGTGWQTYRAGSR